MVFYHLFTERTAGAVDVFFVLTGFLVVSSLLRKFSLGFAGIRTFLTGLFLRLAPVSLLVLLGIYVGSLLFLPPVGTNSVLREIIASALYVENWQLILQGSDYLNRSAPPSPLLHFWAMSVQMQFYLLTVAMFAVAMAILPKKGDDGVPVRPLVIVMATALIASLSYSIYLTYWVSPEWAYFDTLARFWEFLIGALLGAALTIRPELRLPWVFGWLGLAGLFLAGVVGVYQPFPGYAALVPTMSTVLIILAGLSPSRLSVTRFLGSRVMVSLGGIAYTLYLTHWPILIFYREAASADVTWRSGLAIFVVSIALSYGLRFAVEKPLLNRKYGGKSGLVLAASTLPLLALTLAAPATSILLNSSKVTPGSFIGTVQSFGRLTTALDKKDWYPEEVNPETVRPSFEVAAEAVPQVYSDLSHLGETCHVWRDARERVAWCAYGDDSSPTHTIALVGASHSAQWLPALDVLGRENDWRVITLTASDCGFLYPHPTRFPYQECDEVAKEMLEGILAIRPDLVVTIANHSTSAHPEAERIAPWRVLEGEGIPVVAIRDNPTFGEAPSRCLSVHLDDPEACAVERDALLATDFTLGDAPDNVALVDMTDQYCDDLLCPAVIADVLLWRDADHFTSVFVLTMAEVLEARLKEVWIPSPTSTVNLAELRTLVPTTE